MHLLLVRISELLYGLFCWHSFRGDVRPVCCCTLAFITGTEIEKGVRLDLLSIFLDFVKKFAGGDKLYFSPFSVLYIAEEIIKSLLSLTGFPVGVFPGLISQKSLS